MNDIHKVKHKKKNLDINHKKHKEYLKECVLKQGLEKKGKKKLLIPIN